MLLFLTFADSTIAAKHIVKNLELTGAFFNMLVLTPKKIERILKTTHCKTIQNSFGFFFVFISQNTTFTRQKIHNIMQFKTSKPFLTGTNWT
jgi:hypothetical protein